jgi:hypothetical protein
LQENQAKPNRQAFEMSVLLHQSESQIPNSQIDFHLNLTNRNRAIRVGRPIPDIAERLEHGFDKIAPDWWQLGHALSKDENAFLSHTPSCAPNTSDFGLMLTWSLIIENLTKESATTLILCTDPWLFRHLSLIDGVVAGRAPQIWPIALKHALRGWAARIKFMVTAMIKSIKLKRQKHSMPLGKPTLLVYGNPKSQPDGEDGYFGNLMKKQSQLTRVLHVDCPLERARLLSTGDRTTSLDAWGTVFDAFRLPVACWKVSKQNLKTPFKWLIRRAISKENATAQAAAIAWQTICQKHWLEQTRPSVIAWPWENHGWERVLVRQARELNVRTLGYQHSVIGPQMLNYSPASNHDMESSLPDHILCTGPATLNQLLDWGIPKNRLSVGGAFRIPAIRNQKSDPNGPIFLALPFDKRIAQQMVDAAILLIEKGYRFLVKDHPMTPYNFAERDGLKRTEQAYHAIEKLSAVIYAATTVGLESAIAGLPTIRFLPEGIVSLNILPQGVNLPTASALNLEAALKNINLVKLDREKIFSPISLDIWQKWLSK